MSLTRVDVEAVLASIAEPNIVIIGAWHDTRATIPTLPEINHHVPSYLAADPRHNIWCIEPMPHCVVSLEAAALTNSRIHVLPFAVSDHDGEARFFVHPAVDQTNSLRRHAGPIGNPAEGPITEKTVPVRTLDSLMAQGLLPQGADYVTLDVQGCSGEAIRGGQEFFRHSKLVWAEVEFVELYEGQALYPDLQRAFGELGFEQVTEFIDSELASWWSDALFVNRKLMS